MEKTPIITREGAGSNRNQPGEQRKPFLGLVTGTRASRNRNCAGRLSKQPKLWWNSCVGDRFSVPYFETMTAVC